MLVLCMHMHMHMHMQCCALPVTRTRLEVKRILQLRMTLACETFGAHQQGGHWCRMRWCRDGHSTGPAGAGLVLSRTTQSHALVGCSLVHLPVIPQGSIALEQVLAEAAWLWRHGLHKEDLLAQHSTACFASPPARSGCKAHKMAQAAQQMRLVADKRSRHRIPCHATAAKPRSKYARTHLV